MAKYESDEMEVDRVTITLPAETLRQFADWASTAGLKRSQFNSVALVVGARILARQLSPESFMNADAWRGMSEAMGLTPEDAQALVEKSKKG